MPAIVLSTAARNRLPSLLLRDARRDVLRCEKDVSRATYDFVRGIAKQVSSCGVPSPNPPIRVEDKDGVVPNILSQQAIHLALPRRLRIALVHQVLP